MNKSINQMGLGELVTDYIDIDEILDIDTSEIKQYPYININGREVMIDGYFNKLSNGYLVLPCYNQATAERIAASQQSKLGIRKECITIHGHNVVIDIDRANMIDNDYALDRILADINLI